MGGSVARDRTVRSDYVALLQGYLADKYGVLEITWPSLVKAMEQFIWSEEGFGSTVRAFWEETQAIPF